MPQHGDESPRRRRAEPERTCILSGRSGAPDDLIRLAIGPEGEVAPDLGGKLDGRGAWISLDRPLLEKSLASGKLKAALLRAFKGLAMRIPAELSATIASGLERRTLDRLGLIQRSGALASGADLLGKLLNQQRLHLLLHAGDASEDGIRKLGSDVETYRLPCARDALSAALGKANAVHIGVTDKAQASRLRIDIRRWLAYGSALPGESEQNNPSGTETARNA